MISGDDSGQLPSDMWRKIASYAYVSYREAGYGAVLVRQVDSANPSFWQISNTSRGIRRTTSALPVLTP